MVRNCCVEGCKAPWRPDVDLSFFSFPLKNESLLKKWLEIIPTNNRISKSSRICSNHFEESQYDCISGKRILKKEAIPNIFPHDLIKIKEQIEGENLSLECQHDILQNISNDNYNFHYCNTSKQETFLTYIPLPSVSNVLDEAIQVTPQTQNVATQISPRPTEKEEKLRYRIKILQNKLRRREIKILNICRLLKHLKKDCKCSSYLQDHLYAKSSI